MPTSSAAPPSSSPVSIPFLSSSCSRRRRPPQTSLIVALASIFLHPQGPPTNFLWHAKARKTKQANHPADTCPLVLDLGWHRDPSSSFLHSSSLLSAGPRGPRGFSCCGSFDNVPLERMLTWAWFVFPLLFLSLCIACRHVLLLSLSGCCVCSVSS